MEVSTDDPRGLTNFIGSLIKVKEFEELASEWKGLFVVCGLSERRVIHQAEYVVS